MTAPLLSPAQVALSDHELAAIDRWWRAANYLTVGQIYLTDNPLLRRPLAPEDIKPRLLGHWGTSPGLTFIHAHLNRIIRRDDREILFVCGPGHGGPAMLACAWLDGGYEQVYPEIGRNASGMARLFRQFSFPGGVPSHTGPETPGSIHEGGELGYSLAHAFGAAFDNPTLAVACVVGDGEAETGPLAAAWHSISFLDPVHDGVVLPILHLNGYKIANPTILGRFPDEKVEWFFKGLGYTPILVSGADPPSMHRQMAAGLDKAFKLIDAIRSEAGETEPTGVPSWPMIILRSPKGWTGPKEVDGRRVEDFWRAHQVPISNARTNAAHRAQLEQWMQGYRPDELFDAGGRPMSDLLALAPASPMSASRFADGSHRIPLARADWRLHAVDGPVPGGTKAESTRIIGGWLAETMRASASSRNFRIMGPDETVSNRLGAVLDVTDRAWMERIEPYDEHLARDGRVLEILSEHCCEGWLEGYILTGRHGLFNCYEGFAPIVDSMISQHAKWLKVARGLSWRRSVPSLNILLTSHVWQQDHNGFSHQDPGFIDHVANKKADVVRIYLPPDANCLLRTLDHCLATWDRINVVVAGKASMPQWLDHDAADRHCAAGAGIWEWAGTDRDGASPDVVMACCGDVATMETLAAVKLLREYCPHLMIRVVNVVDLMVLQSDREHPHGLTDIAFDALFTADCPVVFAFHGYPHLVHRLTYKRRNHANMHIRGYSEEGTTTTPFDMVVRNRLDRFHLAVAAIDLIPGLAAHAAHARQHLSEALERHRRYIVEHGEDMPEVAEWSWCP